MGQERRGNGEDGIGGAARVMVERAGHERDGGRELGGVSTARQGTNLGEFSFPLTVREEEVNWKTTRGVTCAFVQSWFARFFFSEGYGMVCSFFFFLRGLRDAVVVLDVRTNHPTTSSHLI
jgi:hypothetical protein